MKKDGTKWVLVEQGGGTVKNAPYLERFGVPAATANALVADLNAHGGY